MWLVGIAFGQEASEVTGDLHGSVLPTADGLASSPLFVHTPPRSVPGSFSVGLSTELFTNTAYVQYSDIERAPLLQRGWLTGLSARAALGRRVELFARGGMAHGLLNNGVVGPLPFDVSLGVPVGLVLPEEDGTGFAVGLVPEVTLPTGDEKSRVSHRTVTGGLRAAAVGTTDRFQLAGELGGRAEPGEIVEGYAFGAYRAQVGGAVGVRPAGPWWLHAEARGWWQLGGEGSVPALEVLGSTAVRAGPLLIAAGAGTGLAGGLGAAAFRGFGSVSYVRTPPDRETREVLPPAGVDGYTFQVRSPDGRPVVDAEVVVDGQVVGRSGLDGKVSLAEEPRWNLVEIRAPGYEPAGVERSPEGVVVPVPLGYAPLPVAIHVTDAEGNPLAAEIVARLQSGGGDIPLVDGDRLPPGLYDVLVTAPGFGTQERVLDVYPRGDVEPLAVVLLPEAGRASVAITLVDPTGAPVDGARVLIDGIPVGVTDEGVLTLAGLAPGPHTVEVLHDAFTAVIASGVELTDSAELALPITLQQVPGTVRVVVVTSDGLPVDDAIVRFIGPRRLPPMALGVTGRRTEVLGAGTWVVTVTSARYGLQEREVIVDPDRFELLPVEFVLQEGEAGASEVLIRVFDPDGRPVEGVQVEIDALPYGRTASGGTLAVGNLVPGVRSVTLSRTGLEPIPSRELVVSAGKREEMFTASWSPGAVDVLVREAEGPAEGARVRFVSESRTGPGGPIGPDGHLFATLEPGAWTVAVTSPTAGLQERDLTIDPAADAGRLHRVEFVLAPQEGGLADLAVRVVDPEEHPVDGARVSLDGEQRGATSNVGTLRMSGLDVGTRNLVVWTEPFDANVRDLRLMEGEQELEVELAWAVGATRVRVVRDELPLDDAIVRFLGDHPHPPLPVGADGLALTRLEPGFWLVVATSPTGGVAEWDLEIKDRAAQPSGGLNEVELDMSRHDEGRGDLFVRVVDPYGRPVEHATVWLQGDQKAGETQQGGAVLARDLAPGIVSLRVEAPDFLPTPPIDIELVPGMVEQVVTISWPEVPVLVRVVDEQEQPIEAIVQWVGPHDVPELRSDADGRVDARLSPGTWRAIARAADGRPLSGDVGMVFDLGDEPRAKTLTVRPTRAVMEGGLVSLTDTVPFDFGQATLREDAASIVDELARLLVGRTELARLEVQGHTDNVGGVAANQALSQARAEAVVAALVARGVAREQLVAAGYGPTRPVAANDSEEHRAQNRRVQFVVLERAAPLP